MSIRQLAGTTAIVTGASRGFGRATAFAFAELGVHVVGVARNEKQLEELAAQLGDRFTPEVADAADSSVPARLIPRYRPRTLVLNAGATPIPAPGPSRPGRRSAPTGTPTFSTCSTSPFTR